MGHLFQGRCKTPAVEVESYLLSCGRYIERNPLAAHLVAQPWEYRWSSCRAYVLGEEDPLLAPNPSYLDLAATPKRRQALWQAFLLGEDPKEEEVRRGDWVIGDEAFRARMDHRAARPQPRQRGRRPGRSARAGG